MKVVLAFVLLLAISSPVRATHEVKPYKITGTASHYDCTAGWCDGTATVALPLALGGRYNGRVHGTVTICADRCADIIVVDYCQCYWGSADQRIVDLNEEAWALVTNKPLSAGLVKVTIYSEKVEPEQTLLPNTSMEYSSWHETCQ